MFLRNSKFVGVSIGGAKVGSQLSLTGSRFRGDFNAGGIQVDGDVTARENVEFSNVEFADAQVKGGVDLGGAKVSGSLRSTRARSGA